MNRSRKQNKRSVWTSLNGIHMKSSEFRNIWIHLHVSLGFLEASSTFGLDYITVQAVVSNIRFKYKYITLYNEKCLLLSYSKLMLKPKSTELLRTNGSNSLVKYSHSRVHKLSFWLDLLFAINIFKLKYFPHTYRN